MSSQTKLCYKCDIHVPVEEFKYGYSHCYSCQKAMSRAWKAKHKEKANELSRKWKEENREHVSEYNKQYDAENRETIRKRSTAYHVERCKTDPNFKLAKTLRTRYSSVLKGGRLDDSSLKILGCSIENFKKWLSYRFTDEMAFDNHGKVWDLDHVVAIVKFDLQDEQEIRKCFHWTNFQPLTCSKNRSKNHRVTNEEVEEHEKQLDLFLNSLPEDERNEYSIIDINRKAYVEKPARKRSNRNATKVDT